MNRQFFSIPTKHGTESCAGKDMATERLHFLFQAGGQAAQGTKAVTKAVQLEPIILEPGDQNLKNTTF